MKIYVIAASTVSGWSGDKVLVPAVFTSRQKLETYVSESRLGKPQVLGDKCFTFRDGSVLREYKGHMPGWYQSGNEYVLDLTPHDMEMREVEAAPDWRKEVSRLGYVIDPQVKTKVPA